VDDEPPTLDDRIPNLRRLSLDSLVDAIAKYARVEVGGKHDGAEVDALVQTLGVTLPADYREFLCRFGHLRVVGDESYGFGVLEVFGVGTIEKARAQLRSECRDWAGAEQWLDNKIERSVKPDMFALMTPAGGNARETPPPDAHRRQLVETLELTDREIPSFFDDLRDPLRVAYRHMAPVIQLSDVMHQGVDCFGPNGKLYEVDVKSWSIEPPKGTFAGRLAERLGAVVVVSS
jgi:hypothetical protein